MSNSQTSKTKPDGAYGSWQSPITSDLIVAETIGISGPTFHGGELFWLESRPREGGRNVLVTRDKNGIENDINPSPFNIRTRVHEYGGGAWLLHDRTLFFANFSDQQIYKQVLGESQPTQLTNSPGLRFADGIIDANRNRMISVIEDHRPDGEAENKLGAIDLDTGDVSILATGHDFFASPNLSPDGNKLAWITWDHPDMPWDETVLWQANVNEKGTLHDISEVAGGKVGQQKISVQQPRFSPSGHLYFVSDKSGWWNIHRHDGESQTNVLECEAEFGQPHWGFGLCTYLFMGGAPDDGLHERGQENSQDEKLICIVEENSESRLAVLAVSNNVNKNVNKNIENNVEVDIRNSSSNASRAQRANRSEKHDLTEKSLTETDLTEIDLPYTNINGLSLDGDRLVFMGASPVEFTGIVNLDLQTGMTSSIKKTTDLSLDKGYYSIPETIEFPTGQGELAHGFFYPATNKDYAHQERKEKPPLVVMLHGGPTGATHSALNLRTQFWTSRGIAVLDVNYRGSTGYGRVYRDKLLGNWGIVDVQDSVSGCHYLGDAGLVDMQRLAIRGGSAGGYTALAALAFTDTFSAGASHFGVSDLEALAKDTHKFESRYLDSIIGPYPERLDIYQQRSPIHHVDKLSSACIFFQGLEDKVVPPNQAEAMVRALDKKGIPVAYVPFEGEQHGFRRAENIKRCLDLELYFYSKIFNFTTADQIEPVEIKNLPT